MTNNHRIVSSVACQHVKSFSQWSYCFVLVLAISFFKYFKGSLLQAESILPIGTTRSSKTRLLVVCLLKSPISFIPAICRSKINMSDFELLLREQTIREWKDLDMIHPHDAHVSSRVMRTTSL